jgi:hypothetical protein
MSVLRFTDSDYSFEIGIIKLLFVNTNDAMYNIYISTYHYIPFDTSFYLAEMDICYWNKMTLTLIVKKYNSYL